MVQELVAKFLSTGLGGNLTWTLVALAVGAGLAKLPDLAGRLFGKGLDIALARGDEADDALLLALVKWAEAKVPTEGAGEEKFKLVAHTASQMLPFLHLDEARLADAIEKAVQKMKEEADKRD